MELLSNHARILIAAPIYGLAYLVAALVFWGMARRRNMATEGISVLLVVGLVGGLAAANLAQLIFTGQPGKSIEGGIAGGWLAVVLAKRYLRIRRPTGDLFAPAISAGESIGRIACFIGGCCYGKVATLAWATYERGALRQPTQLYLAAWAALTYGVLVVLDRRRVLPENGLFLVQGLLFCSGRFVVEFYRTAPALAFGFTAAQLGALAGIVVFGTLALRMYARTKYTERALAAASA